MTPRAGVTAEGREQERVSTERKKRGAARWLMPLLLALPFLGAAAFAVIRFGPVITKLLSAAVKLVVVS